MQRENKNFIENSINMKILLISNMVCLRNSSNSFLSLVENEVFYNIFNSYGIIFFLFNNLNR